MEALMTQSEIDLEKAKTLSLLKQMAKKHGSIPRSDKQGKKESISKIAALSRYYGELRAKSDRLAAAQVADSSAD